MTRTFRLASLAVLLVTPFVLGRPEPAVADSRGSTVTVTTTVSASCNLSAATLAFTAYDPINTHATSPNDASGMITIRCTKGATGITIDLGAGANNSGGQRRMVHATNAAVHLDYEIYKESGRQNIWGSGDNGSVYEGSSLDGTGGDVSVTMYGRIPAGQLQAIAGSYTDTVVSTINF